MFKDKSIIENIKRKYEETLLANRQNLQFHHSITREKNINNGIKAGDKKAILEYYKKPMDGNIGILAKNNSLRSEKNLLICTVVLSTRAAIDGGLDAEVAYTLSDAYIQTIEEISDIDIIKKLQEYVVCDFAERVHEVNEKKYSKVIMDCENYISNNIYEQLSLSSISTYVKLSPNYLSGLFKEQIGVSISEYILKAKIEESKNLLKTTSSSILDVSVLLNFNSQSYFTKIFKRYTGITPKKFRNY